MKLLAVALACASISLAPRIANSQVIPHYSATPGSTSEMVEKADAVVRGRVEHKRYDNDRTTFKSAMTEHKIRVTEVLKTDGQLRVGDVITVYCFGGAENGKVIRESGFRPFEQGDDLLLFLDWAPVAKVYLPLFGPDGSYKIDTYGRAQPFGTQVAAKANSGRSADDLLAEIRKLKR